MKDIEPKKGKSETKNQQNQLKNTSEKKSPGRCPVKYKPRPYYNLSTLNNAAEDRR